MTPIGEDLFPRPSLKDRLRSFLADVFPSQASLSGDPIRRFDNLPDPSLGQSVKIVTFDPSLASIVVTNVGTMYAYVDTTSRVDTTKYPIGPGGLPVILPPSDWYATGEQADGSGAAQLADLRVLVTRR